jgi:hypothetical protein
VEENRRGPGGEGFPAEEQGNTGNDILNLLGERTKTPGEAFVLLQQLTIFIWDQYKIDWKDHEGHKVADTRKQRYLDFASELIDSIKTSEPSMPEAGPESEPAPKSETKPTTKAKPRSKAKPDSK